MPPSHDQILLFSQLPPGEQAEIQAYVDRHPELAPLLAEASALGDALADARTLLVRPPTDEALAYCYVTRRLSHAPPPVVEHLLDDIERCIGSDADVRARYEAVRARIDELEAGSDPVQRFRALSGHDVSRPAHADRPAQRQARRLGTRAGRWASAACIVLVLGIGGMLGASRLSTSPLERLGRVSPATAAAYSTTVRGAAPAVRAADEARLAQAVARLAAAERTTFGLFLRYDAGALARTGAVLDDVRASAASQETRAEAAFFLGKLHLMRDDAAAAREALEAVDAGPWQGEAHALLEVLDAR